MGTLFIVSTPIGNSRDITYRAAEILIQSRIILCEDTKHTSLFLHTLSTSLSLPLTEKKYIRYDRFTEGKRNPEIVEMLTDGLDIVLCSDAGTPILSDPGTQLVSVCRKRNIPVMSIPGASALLSALVVSGYPATPLLFYGFPPEKPSHSFRLLSSIKQMTIADQSFQATIVFYISPHDLERFLTVLLSSWGDIQITVARELTKLHEEVWSGSVSDAREKFKNGKGEFVLLWRVE